MGRPTCWIGINTSRVGCSVRALAGRWYHAATIRETRSDSGDPDAVLLQGLVAKLEPESRRLRQRHEAVHDGRALAKELEPQGIASRVCEGFQDEPGRTGRHRVDMDLRIVMGGQRHLIELG